MKYKIESHICKPLCSIEADIGLSIEQVLELCGYTVISGSGEYDYYFEDIFGGNQELGDYYPVREGIYEDSTGKFVNPLKDYFIVPDYSGEDLSQVDMSQQDLRGINFSGANLTDADLSGAYLDGGNLSNIRAWNANFTNTDLWGVCLAGADLRGACFAGADLTGADLTGALLDGADLTDATLPIKADR